MSPLTSARAHALAVLGAGPARYSNLTSWEPQRCVYWQATDWLIGKGFAEFVPGEPIRTNVRITAEGRQQLAIIEATERVTGRRR